MKINMKFVYFNAFNPKTHDPIDDMVKLPVLKIVTDVVEKFVCNDDDIVKGKVEMPVVESVEAATLVNVQAKVVVSKVGLSSKVLQKTSSLSCLAIVEYKNLSDVAQLK